MTESDLQFRSLAGAMPARVATATEAQWVSQLRRPLQPRVARLVAMWGSDRRDVDAVGEGFVVHAAYAVHDGLACVRLPMSHESNEPPEYPALSTQYPAAVRMQRALFDLLGVRARNADDQRPWLRHAAWPADFFPLRRDNRPSDRLRGTTGAIPVRYSCR